MKNDFRKIEFQGIILEVNSEGIIKKDNKILKQRLNHDGYPEVWLSTKKHKRGTTARVHRLVALAFIPNPDNKPEVNHKDYNRANPNLNNLEWVTHHENILYSKCNMPDYHGENNPNYGNHKLSKRYADDKKLSIEKQGRPGLQNGRCQKIKLFYDGLLIKEFNYIKECIIYMIDNYNELVNFKDKGNAGINTIRGRINDSIRKNIPYKKHFTFEKL